MNTQYKKHGLILLGIILVICIFSGMVFYQRDVKDTHLNKTQESEMDVYLLHEEMLIRYPTITETQKSDEKIREIIHYLGQSASSFEALLSEGTQLNDVNIKDKVAVLDFETLKYKKDKERKLLESLIFSCTQFSDVNSIRISLKGKALTSLEKNHTPLIDTSQNFGINHVDTNQIYLHKGNEVVLSYQCVIDGKKYDVPRSIRLNHIDDYNEVMNVMLAVPSGCYQLNQPLADKNILMEKPIRFEDGVLHLYLNKNILATNKKLDSECVHYLKRNFTQFEAIRALKIHVDKKIFDVIVKK